MAKMTKAEKFAVEQADQAVRNALEAAEYPNRLMQALEMATTKFYMELLAKNKMFKLTDLSRDDEWVLSPTWNDDAWKLSNLEVYLERRQAETVEAERKSTLRRDVMSRLTEEEKEVLDLK